MMQIPKEHVLTSVTADSDTDYVLPVRLSVPCDRSFNVCVSIRPLDAFIRLRFNSVGAGVLKLNGYHISNSSFQQVWYGYHINL